MEDVECRDALAPSAGLQFIEAASLEDGEAEARGDLAEQAARPPQRYEFIARESGDDGTPLGGPVLPLISGVIGGTPPANNSWKERFT